MDTDRILPIHWQEFLAAQPETGMDYQVVKIRLVDGRVFSQVAIIGATRIGQVRGSPKIPFKASDIADVILTHEKWDFNAS